MSGQLLRFPTFRKIQPSCIRSFSNKHMHHSRYHSLQIPDDIKHKNQQPSLRVAVVQKHAFPDLNDNLKHTERMVAEAKNNNANLVVLPGLFAVYPSHKTIFDSRETIPGPRTIFLSNLARKYGVYIVGGTLAERVQNTTKFYHALPVHNPDGRLLGSYRKMHIYDEDSDLEGAIVQSDVMLSGNSLLTFKAGGLKIGVGICYDVVFPEFSRLLSLRGCKMIIFSGSFPQKYGYTLSSFLGSRAIENQAYVIMASPTCNTSHPFVSCGRSSIYSPRGKLLQETQENDEKILYTNIEKSAVDSFRKELPVISHTRSDLYHLNFNQQHSQQDMTQVMM